MSTAASYQPCEDGTDREHKFEAILAAFIDYTQDHVWSVDLDFRLIAFSQALQQDMEKAMGIRLVPGMRLHELLPPERAQLWEPYYRHALAQGPFKIEYPIPGPRILEFSFNPIRLRGETTGVSVIGRDISDARRNEAALVESEGAFRRIFEENSSVMLLVDPASGEVVNANRAAAAFFGQPRECLVGKDLAALNSITREDIAQDQMPVLSGKTSMAARRVTVAGGKERDIEIYLTPYENFGHPLIFAILHDVTERVRMEESLRESEEFLKESQTIGGLGSYVYDIRTGDWWGSDVLDGLFGIGKDFDHTVGGWTSLIHPDDRETMSAYLVNEVVKARGRFNREYRVVRNNDQAVRWVHGLGRLEFDDRGNPIRMRGVIKDITERKESELRLRESEERFRATFEQAAVGILHTSLDGRILRSNHRFAEIIGYDIGEIPGLTFQQITRAEDLAESLAVMNAMKEGATSQASWEKCYVRKDGSNAWVKLTVSPLCDAHGRLQHFITVVQDINARKAAEAHVAAMQEKLRASETLYRTAFQTSFDAIYIVRLVDARYVEVNEAFLDLVGYERHEVMGRSALSLGIWADARDRATAIELVLKEKVIHNIEVRLRKKSGETFWALMSASLIDIAGQDCLLVVTRDISGIKASENQIRNLIFFDPLTSLPNRHMLLDRLRMAIESEDSNQGAKALLLIDLDNFKTLNDTLGHPVGDLLLQEIARRLARCVHDADTLARLGADEFVLLIENLSPVPEEAERSARELAHRVLAGISEPCQLAGRECCATASVGIRMMGDDEHSADLVLQQADIAIGQAKAAGTNAVRFFSMAQQAAIHVRASMEDDLRKAIAARQFELYYQPQLFRRRLLGAEALIRWKHPRRGILAPGEFITLAEETGLILPMGEWVLETACQQIAAWADRGNSAGVSISVNISALQFRQPDFVDRVMAAIEHAGANPRNLNLELTESMLVENMEDIVSKMIELKSRGLRFSLDDFGTGYSSLAYLKQLPLDQLKIDRAFVRDILVDESSGAIAQTIIALGRAMGLSVLAEGVETEEQLNYLTSLGCYCFQGYLFGRPIPVENFEQRWLPSALAEVGDAVPVAR